MDTDSLKKVKMAELMASAGALVLGIGIGALAGAWIGPAGGVMVLLGGALHARGMIVKHRYEASLAIPAWWVWLYRLCWAGLIVVGVLILVRLLP